MGEDVLRILPKGAHAYSNYINEHELRHWLKNQDNWEFVRSDGCMSVPFRGWKLNNTQQQAITSSLLERNKPKGNSYP